jgi:bifunctional DNA-binding transcriptional regulator/antitoxin component of YhaV-PrlF toxin-antitoxin module
MTSLQYEGVSRSFDNLGRITIPKAIRTKHECEVGEKYDINTIVIDGKVFIAIGPINNKD